MSVTQDYKLLTLTQSEYKSVCAAVGIRINHLKQTIVFFDGTEVYAEVVRSMKEELVNLQSAMAKQATTQKAEVLTHMQLSARAAASAFNIEELMTLSAAMAEYHNRYSTGAPPKREAAMVSAWDKLHLAVQVQQ